MAAKQMSIAQFLINARNQKQKDEDNQRQQQAQKQQQQRTKPPTTIKDFFEPFSSSPSRAKKKDENATEVSETLLTLPSPSKFERKTQPKVPFKPRRKLTFTSHRSEDRWQDGKKINEDNLEDLLAEVEPSKTSAKVQEKEKTIEDVTCDVITDSPHCSTVTSQELRTPSKRAHLHETSSFETPSKLKVDGSNQNQLLTSPKKTTDKQTANDTDNNNVVVTSSKEAVTSITRMKPSKNLVLPHKYKKLEEQFKYLDHFVSSNWNRQEATEWSYIEENMRRATRNLYTRKELGQIKYLYPEAFEFGLTEVTAKNAAIKQQLIVKPIYRQFGIDKQKMSGFLMVKRRSEFKLRLLNQVRIHHRNFLTKFDSSLLIEDEEITSWHPKFKINDLPDVPSSPLPSSSSSTPPRIMSARQLLERRGLTNKAIKCITAIAERNEAKLAQEKAEPAKPETITTTNKQVDQFKGIPASLLEKIRRKELRRMKCNMIRSEDDEKKLNQLKSLPHIAQLLATLYRSEKKGSLKFEFVCMKLQRQSSKYIQSAMGLEVQLRLMAEDSLNWITIIALGTNEYIKMNRDVKMSDVIRYLDKRWRKFETTN